MLLEVEFASVAASRDFSLPAYVTLEVTEDPAYKNARLALCGLPESFLRVQRPAQATPGKEPDERH